MKVFRKLNSETNLYEMYALPNDSGLSIEQGIPVDIFDLCHLELDVIRLDINDTVTAYIERQQATPNFDTLVKLISASVIRNINKLKLGV